MNRPWRFLTSTRKPPMRLSCVNVHTTCSADDQYQCSSEAGETVLGPVQGAHTGLPAGQ